MDFKNMVDKAKDWARDNPEKADGYVDRGTDAVKSRFAGHDEQVDGAAEKAKNYLHGPGEPAPGQAPPPPPEGEQPPPPPQ